MSPSGRDTPMMRHYLEIKAQHPNAIVLYRMGDFYELFLEDAELAAPLLELTLTTRDKGKVDAIPMCGFPVHSADGYVRRLAELGQRVAICEQVEDARAAGGRRLVRREVVEVVTPGLVGDPEGLEAVREVSLVALAAVSDGRGGLAQLGIAVLDATTGDFRATEIERDDAGEDGIAALRVPNVFGCSTAASIHNRSKDRIPPGIVVAVTLAQDVAKGPQAIRQGGLGTGRDRE